MVMRLGLMRAEHIMILQRERQSLDQPDVTRERLGHGCLNMLRKEVIFYFGRKRTACICSTNKMVFSRRVYRLNLRLPKTFCVGERY